ncbi:MAG: TM2 domain-containing protein [Mycobacteriaceae bacterium]|nr:TM2 domain-containing protein [Mycobacteriaceae bacterium]
MTEPPFSGSEYPQQQPQNPYPAPGGQYPPPYQGQPAPYPPPGGPPAGYPGAQPGALWGVDPYGRPLSDKSKLTAGLLQIFLGGFGVGRFYLGYTNIGVLQLVVTIVTCGIGSIWGLIDGIMILIGNVPDPEGRPLRD